MVKIIRNVTIATLYIVLLLKHPIFFTSILIKTKIYLPLFQGILKSIYTKIILYLLSFINVKEYWQAGQGGTHLAILHKIPLRDFC